MSASSTPTLCPAAASAAARFTVTDDLPTPPLPLATANTRVRDEGSANGTTRSVRPPRSLPCSSRRCSSLITSRCTAAPVTPGTADTAAVTSLVMVSRSGQAATVRYTSTRTLPPGPTSTLLTMPSSVIGRRISGSLTPASAAVTCSAVGGETAGGAAILPMLCARAGRRLRCQPVHRHQAGVQVGVEPARRQRSDDRGPLRRPGLYPVDAGRPGDQRPAGVLAGHGDRDPARTGPPGHGQPDHPRAPGRLRDQGGRRETTQHAPFVQRLFEPGAEREAGQVARAEPAGIVRVVARGERAAGHGRRVVPDHQHLAARARPVHRADQRAGDHVQAGFLAHLADQGLLVGFPGLDPPPGQRPAPRLGLVPAPDEQNPPAGDDDGADAGDPLLRHGPSITRNGPADNARTRGA